jgi:hypothetical protein
MSAAVRAVIVAMNWLATPAKVSGGVDLIFNDSFEECLAEPLVLWSGGGDGTSRSDPLNWFPLRQKTWQSVKCALTPFE